MSERQAFMRLLRKWRGRCVTCGVSIDHDKIVCVAHRPWHLAVALLMERADTAEAVVKVEVRG